MRIIRNILIGLVSLVLVLAAGAYLLPRNVVVERQVTIDAAPDAVFPYVNSLRQMSDWSPWLDRDPEVEIAYAGPDDGVGATMAWTSDEPSVGNGRQEIVESIEDERVMTALDFGDMGTADAWIDLEPSADGTIVTWGLNADMGNSPVGRWMGLMMDGMVGADYDRGLANLKTLVETGGS